MGAADPRSATGAAGHAPLDSLQRPERGTVFLGPPVTEGLGLWRSLVAHLTGGQGVAGSNPVNPTDKAPATRVKPSGRSFFVA